MSYLNKITSETKSIAEDLAAAQNLEPVILAINSAFEAATTKESFKDRVVDNWSKGKQAFQRLMEQAAPLSTLGSMFQLWSKPTIPSVVIREHFPMTGITPEQSAQNAAWGSMEAGLREVGTTTK